MKIRNVVIAGIVFGVFTLAVDVAAQSRIRFPIGRTSTSTSGTISPSGAKSFVLGARYGQFLSANVSSRDDCINFSNGATSTSYITRNGNNFLYLRNRCGRAVRFTLTVSINYGSD
ncbi:MAG: hypothetical protein ABR530_08435 [Pyrinomonadaceae bacterium]